MGIERNPDLEPLTIVINHEVHSIFLYDRDGYILTSDRWRGLRKRLDLFYQTCSDLEISQYNHDLLQERKRAALERAEEVALALGGEAAETRSKDPSPGYVYMIYAAEVGLFKIGVTKDPQARLKALQNASPDKLELVWSVPAMDTLAVEKKLHRYFAQRHHHGEWFRLTLHEARWVQGIVREEDVQGI